MEYVNARWMQSLHGFLYGIKWIMFHGHLDYSQKPSLGGRPNTKPGDHGTPNTHDQFFSIHIKCRAMEAPSAFNNERGSQHHY